MSTYFLLLYEVHADIIVLGGVPCLSKRRWEAAV
jgi:hypothetical protein